MTITDPEFANAGARIEAHYTSHPERYAARETRIDHLGMARWPTDYYTLRLQGRDHEAAIRTVESRIAQAAGTTDPWGPGPGPPAPPPIPGSGLMRMAGRICGDDHGPMNALGTTLFWGLWGYKHDRARLQLHFDWAAQRNIRFFRMLGEVRDTNPALPPFWRDQAIVPVGSQGYPEWPDYEEMVAGCTQMAMDYGMRVEWSIFGTGRDDKQRTVRRFLDGIAPVMAGVQMVEVANENNGFSGVTEMRQLASMIRSAVGQDFPLALTAISLDPAVVHPLYDGSAANLFTLHFERDTTENGWRPVRQVWGGKDFGPFCNNEPVGPQSSGASEVDPERLVFGQLNAWLTGACMSVIHTGAGVRGVADPARGRVANLWEVPALDPTTRALQALVPLLPPDLAQWTTENFYWSGHPFEMDGFVGDPALAANHGCVRCFAAHAGAQFVTAPFGIMQDFAMKARSAMHVRCYDWTGHLYEERSLAAGERLTFVGRNSALVIGSR